MLKYRAIIHTGPSHYLMSVPICTLVEPLDKKHLMLYYGNSLNALSGSTYEHNRYLVSWPCSINPDTLENACE